MQEGGGALRVCGGLEDRALIALQDLQPRFHVACMIGPWFELGYDSEICADQRRSWPEPLELVHP